MSHTPRGISRYRGRRGRGVCVDTRAAWTAVTLVRFYRRHNGDMAIPIFQVDAFSDQPFSGTRRPFACSDGARSDAWMQNVAAEMNLSETAFVTAIVDGFSLRWFTPRVEVDLCGHATLAAAHVLWESGRLPPTQTACFQTRGGRLTARRESDLIELDFPATRAEATEIPAGLAAALGCAPRSVPSEPFRLPGRGRVRASRRRTGARRGFFGENAGAGHHRH